MLSKEGLLREGHEAWCEEISQLSSEQLVLGGAARTMHQWLRDARVKGGDAKGDKMVQAGQEVLFKTKKTPTSRRCYRVSRNGLYQPAREVGGFSRTGGPK